MKFLAHLFFWLAILSGGLGLAGAHFRLALSIVSFGLVAAALVLGGIGFFLSLIALIRADHGRNLLALFMLLELPCLALVGYGVWLGSQHPINDITTDTVQVPSFIQPLEMATVHSGKEYLTDVPVMERPYNPEFALIQKNIYAGVTTATQKASPEVSYRAALLTIKEAFPHWKIVKEDPQAMLIQAEEETGFFHFVDDVLIRITPFPDDKTLSRLDVRSRSRYGRSDFGLNAKRIISFIVKVNERVARMDR